RLPGPVAPGPAAFTRRFGYPGRIDDHERVWLVIEGLAAPAAVSLNGEPLGRWEGETDITRRLAARNELAIATDSGGAPPWAEVALEVRATAWLRRLSLGRSAAGIEAAGEAVGGPAEPLDVYLIAGRRTVAYLSLIPSAQGTPFRLAGLPEEGEDGPARVELVRGAVVWYSAPLEGPG
ncbi:MAG: hypothetical protein K2W96_09305, partial [Gemmataceae bacterium]|nr:hypothetical protein [Gemmataceae bacterium]